MVCTGTPRIPFSLAVWVQHRSTAVATRPRLGTIPGPDLVAAATKVEEHELDAILPGLGLLGGLVAILERGAVAAATQELEPDGLDATLLLLLLGLLGRLAATPEPDAAEAAMQELEQDGFRAILLPELLVLGLLVLLVHLQLAPILPVVLAIWTAREEVYEQALQDHLA